MVDPRRICVVTGSRADYGHLQPVMTAIAGDTGLRLQIVACAQHLEPRFGETWRAIADDGFAIDAKVPFNLGLDTPLAIAEAAGQGMAGLARAFASLRPDIILVLGDRFEILAAASAALMLGIPLAHIHGGEITEAAMDDAIRHSLTKMSALHFAAAEAYARRIRQMGEEPARVVVSGAPGLDHLTTMRFVDRAALGAHLNLDLGGTFLIVTYHPVTLDADHGLSGMTALLTALDTFKDAAIVFTGVNSDPGHGALHEAVTRFAAADPNRRRAVMSLGQLRYLSAVKAADAVVGNSSSGLIEAPALGTPTVNIGDRQKGRLRSPSVIDCAPDTGSIRAAVAKALEPTFRTAMGHAPAYRAGGAAERIVAALKQADLSQLSHKRFQDIIPPA